LGSFHSGENPAGSGGKGGDDEDIVINGVGNENVKYGEN
jgi:hypothetical protein